MIYLLESRNPVFIRSIAPTTISQYTQYCFVVASQRLVEPHITPFVVPTPAAYLPHKFAQPFPILLSESHTCFFLSQNTGTYMFFLKIHISTPFSELIYLPPPPPLITYSICLVLTIINFNVSFVLF